MPVLDRVVAELKSTSPERPGAMIAGLRGIGSLGHMGWGLASASDDLNAEARDTRSASTWCKRTPLHASPERPRRHRETGPISVTRIAVNSEALVEAAFIRLFSAWRRSTAGYSVTGQKIDHPDYKAMIALGWSAVPFLLRELERSPHLDVALQKITGENPAASVRPGDMRATVRAWLTWGRSQKRV